jgi:hypothetical protein
VREEQLNKTFRNKILGDMVHVAQKLRFSVLWIYD